MLEKPLVMPIDFSSETAFRSSYIPSQASIEFCLLGSTRSLIIPTGKMLCFALPLLLKEAVAYSSSLSTASLMPNPSC